MGFLKPFRTRSSERVRKGLSDRLSRLADAVDQMRRDIERERDGLATRSRTAGDDAAFAQQRDEDERGDPQLAERIESLTGELLRGERRQRVLERQSDFAARLRADIEAFRSGLERARQD
jgi:hypothetical protein